MDKVCGQKGHRAHRSFSGGGVQLWVLVNLVLPLSLGIMVMSRRVDVEWGFMWWWWLGLGWPGFVGIWLEISRPRREVWWCCEQPNGVPAK